MINLLNDQKTVVRISPDKLKAVTDMLEKFSDKLVAFNHRLSCSAVKDVLYLNIKMWRG